MHGQNHIKHELFVYFVPAKRFLDEELSLYGVTDSLPITVLYTVLWQQNIFRSPYITKRIASCVWPWLIIRMESAVCL